MGKRRKEKFKSKDQSLKHGGHPSGKAIAGSYVGELTLHRDGYGFVVSPDKTAEDAFIPARFIGDALHTDLVEVKITRGRGGKPEGRIKRVIERRLKRIMGRFEKQGRISRVVADDRRIKHRIMIGDGDVGGARHGDNVVVLITAYPVGDIPMKGKVVDVLGKRGDIETERTAVIVRHNLVREFSKSVSDDAEKLSGLVSEAERDPGRINLRRLPFVTIDGESARDFDDAVCVERSGDGVIRLWVSIADVSYFVEQGSAIDRAAIERTTSVYFPDLCLPMLPGVLSNDLCSLRPGEPKLTVTAELDIAVDGDVVHSKFYRSIIESRERMTYTNVRRILVDRSNEVRERYKNLLPQFELMKECFERLKVKRKKRGSIDFDLPEPEIQIDMRGSITDIVRAERHIGHMMIEEFMIAANESVAEFLTNRKAGCIYRVHESPPPDKLYELSLLLHNLGYKTRLSKNISPKALVGILEMVKGNPEERLVGHMMLRSMSQAVYSDDNVGHFGLASKCYCHFTSPIRRYPDLVVHRLLSQTMDMGGGGDHGKRGRRRFHGDLKGISEQCSRQERVSMEAEREVAKLYATLFMQEKVGDVYEGIISHVTKFGFFVELIDYFVEGLVHVTTLVDDNYTFVEDGLMFLGKRLKKRYRIGDKVKVEVAEVDIPERQVQFVLV